MNPRFANILVVVLEAIALVAVGVLAIDTVSLIADVGNGHYPLNFDSGQSYLVLMLVFPWLHLCGAVRRTWKIPLRRLSQLTAAFFVLLLVTAWVTPRYIERTLASAGYIACPMEQQHRVSPGASRVYTLRPGECAGVPPE